MRPVAVALSLSSAHTPQHTQSAKMAQSTWCESHAVAQWLPPEVPKRCAFVPPDTMVVTVWAWVRQRAGCSAWRRGRYEGEVCRGFQIHRLACVYTYMV
jgi:hypothetical protein